MHLLKEVTSEQRPERTEEGSCEKVWRKRVQKRSRADANVLCRCNKQGVSEEPESQHG